MSSTTCNMTEEQKVAWNKADLERVQDLAKRKICFSCDGPWDERYPTCGLYRGIQLYQCAKCGVKLEESWKAFVECVETMTPKERSEFEGEVFNDWKEAEAEKDDTYESSSSQFDSRNGMGERKVEFNG